MISSVVSFAIRLLLTLATVVLGLSLLAVAFVTMLVVIVWSLIRGRKPRIDVSGFARARGKFRAAGGKPVGEVVDVEVREVPDSAPRLDR